MLLGDVFWGESTRVSDRFNVSVTAGSICLLDGSAYKYDDRA